MYLTVIALLNLWRIINCLNLDNYGINKNYYSSSISVFRNRAFLALPRTSCYNNITQPTLIEAYWNAEHQTLLPGRRLFYPSENYQNWGKCEQLQNVISIDIEMKKGRLWILDKGNEMCSSKVVVFNLFTNSQIWFYEIDEKNYVSFLVVDGYGLRAYIGNKIINTLFMLSVIDQTLTVVEISSSKQSFHVMPERLSLSKLEPTLYMTSDQGDQLFKLNLSEITSANNFTKVTATYVGNKLGPSGGMITDLGDGLNYYLTRDFAILRWIIGKPVKAEYHDVLLQSYELLPYVPHLFTDFQNNIWALVSPVRPQDCHTMEDRQNFQLTNEVPLVTSRIVKLSKFKKGRKMNLLLKKYVNIL